MAAIATRATGSREPLPRCDHNGVAVGKELYLLAGRTKGFDDAEMRAQLSLLESFDPLAELWLTPARTTGDHPPGLYGGAIAAAGGSLYHYGGYDGVSDFNALSKLDIPTLNWSLLSQVSTGPMPKTGCGMICFEGHVLCVWGGYGNPSGQIQAGSDFVRNKRNTSGRGWTNELHFFHLKEGIFCLS